MVFERSIGKGRLLFTLMVALMSVALVACGDGDDSSSSEGSESTPAATGGGGGAAGTGPATGSPGESTTTIDYSSISGNVRVDGSSTVFPIGEAMAEEFSKVSNARVNVAFSGTGGGFEKFCRSETDFAQASRPIRDSERAACAENGRSDILELQVAIDALTVMVNASNDWVECLSVQQLHDIFRNGGVVNWNEVDSSFPDAPISGYVPGTDSGTFDYFVEAIIAGVDGEAGHRGDFTASEDDNILVRGIQNDRNAIGYFGFAYYLEAGQALKAVEIDGGEGCVAPTFENALNGTYQPLSRPLFIYTSESLLRENEAALGFLDFYVNTLQEIVPQVGYVSMPDDLYQEQVAKVEPFLP